MSVLTRHDPAFDARPFALAILYELGILPRSIDARTHHLVLSLLHAAYSRPVS